MTETDAGPDSRLDQVAFLLTVAGSVTWFIVDLVTGVVLTDGFWDIASTVSYCLWALVLAIAWRNLKTAAVGLLVGATVVLPLIGGTLELFLAVLAFAGLVSAYIYGTFALVYLGLVLMWGLYAFIWLISEDAASSFSDVWLYVPLFAVPVMGVAFFGHQFRKVRSRKSAMEAALARSDVEHAAAIAEQRRGLARDLHDIVAHDLTLIRTQAQAVSDLEASPPVQQALANINEASRTALVDLRRLLHVLGHEGAISDATSDAPELNLERGLKRFSHSLQELGFSTSTTVNGDLETITQSLQVGIYRVLQECITNVIKHGLPSGEDDPPDCSISVNVRDDAVALEVTNRINSQPMAAAGQGLGLQSCRERIERLGGCFETGRASEGFWRAKAEVARNYPLNQ